MSTLIQTVKKLKGFDFEKELLNVVKDNDTIALDLNRNDQLGKQGITSAELSLPQYKPFTKELKIGLPGFAGVIDHMTLFGEGDFHKSLFLHTDKFPVLFDATDHKVFLLTKKYGDSILGLTDGNQNKFNRKILKDVQEANRKGIGI